MRLSRPTPWKDEGRFSARKLAEGFPSAAASGIWQQKWKCFQLGAGANLRLTAGRRQQVRRSDEATCSRGQLEAGLRWARLPPLCGLLGELAQG